MFMARAAFGGLDLPLRRSRSRRPPSGPGSAWRGVRWAQRAVTSPKWTVKW